MSFLDKFKKIVSQTEAISSKDVDTLKSDRRYNERLGLIGCDLVHVKLANQIYSPFDISYGGVGIFLNQDELNSLSVGSTFSGEIITPIGNVSCGFESARFGKNASGQVVGGLVFHHESRKSLMFLRDIIEPLRQGDTLTKIQPDHMSQEKIALGVSYFRGDGPCDLSIGVDRSFTLTFILPSGQYGELRLRNDHLGTSITLPTNNNRVGQQIAETNKLDLEILQHGYLILCGAMGRHEPAVAPLVEATQEKFNSWRSKQSA